MCIPIRREIKIADQMATRLLVLPRRLRWCVVVSSEPSRHYDVSFAKHARVMERLKHLYSFNLYTVVGETWISCAEQPLSFDDCNSMDWSIVCMG